MADIIIIAILAVVVFLILRDRVRKLRSGQCSGGCSGCSSSCSGCACCSGGCAGTAEKKAV